jgi:hypothetical protein
MTTKSATTQDEILDLMARHDGVWPPSRRVGDGERYIFAVLEERGLVYRVRALTRCGRGYTYRLNPDGGRTRYLGQRMIGPGKEMK